MQYRSLLDNVISAARRTTFPSQGTFDMSALSTSPYYDSVEEPFGLHPISWPKIGAAGELFVGNTKMAVKEAGLMSK
jgi:hypothetical protein